MPRRRSIAATPIVNDESQVTLCEVLDRVLAKGVVAQGTLTIVVADIPLIEVGLSALLSSVETLNDACQGVQG